MKWNAHALMSSAQTHGSILTPSEHKYDAGSVNDLWFWGTITLKKMVVHLVRLLGGHCMAQNLM